MLIKRLMLAAAALGLLISLRAGASEIIPADSSGDLSKPASRTLNSQSPGNDLQDSLTTVNSEINVPDSVQRVLPRDFTFAGGRRYTIDGSLPLSVTKIKPIPAAIMGILYTGIFIAQHEAQAGTIWQKKAPFKTIEDGPWTAYLDKAGHFYGAFMPSYLFNESLMMAGFSYDASAIWASAMGLAYTTYVEIADGFSGDFGFSPSDFYADVAGSAFFLAQHYVPYLQNFTPKFQYINPNWLGEQDRFPHDAFIDNYSSQVFWMSANVHNMLPVELKKYWPAWMELSFGYAVYSLCDIAKAEAARQADPDFCYRCNAEEFTTGQRGNKRFIVALDYNLRELLPDGPGFWNWLRQGLNYFKLPSPALEFGSVTKFYLIYPIDIKINIQRM